MRGRHLQDLHRQLLGQVDAGQMVRPLAVAERQIVDRPVPRRRQRLVVAILVTFQCDFEGPGILRPDIVLSDREGSSCGADFLAAAADYWRRTGRRAHAG
jgi:hypothetical protein